jgi:hypothetical protein
MTRDILINEQFTPGRRHDRISGTHRVDLDWDDGAVFCRITDSHPAGMEHEERPEWTCNDDVLELLYVADPCRNTDETPIAPPGYWHPRWDDDTYRFVLVAAAEIGAPVDATNLASPAPG